jgi:hypothetical protein
VEDLCGNVENFVENQTEKINKNNLKKIKKST